MNLELGMFKDIFGFMLEHKSITALVIVCVLGLIIGLVVSRSHFEVSNNLNWGASPYLELAYNDKSDDKYEWNEVKKVNLDMLVPEYNFKSQIVDWKFGDQVYDSDNAMVLNAPGMEAKTTVLVPAAQAASPPVIVPAVQTNPPTVMVPSAAPVGAVMLSVPAGAAASPPVVIPSQSTFPVATVAVPAVPAVSTFRSSYY